jgi:hypothetical protein
VLKNSFALSSTPGSGAENAVFVVFWPCFRALLDTDRADNGFFNSLDRFRNGRLTQGLNRSAEQRRSPKFVGTGFSEVRQESFNKKFIRVMRRSPLRSMLQRLREKGTLAATGRGNKAEESLSWGERNEKHVCVPTLVVTG